MNHPLARLLCLLWRGTVGLLALLALVASVQAARFEVAQSHPQAIDSGPGTAERPWRTLTKAAASVGPGDVVVEQNNTKNFSRGWEAGGDKLVLCRGAVLERSRFLRNRGNGIWFDIGNEQCVVRQCLIADNEDAGIFYEISYSLHAHDNVIVGNGFASTSGAWGAQAGIALSSSPDCVIERNLLVANREGFNFREQFRTTPTLEDKRERAVWNHDEIIRHNIMAYNRDAQVWGWFDVNDHRHWPAKDAPPGATAPPAAKPGDLAADYGAKDARGQPVGLTLEKLHIRFENNAYFASPSQGLFKWGTLWGRHQEYGAVAGFQAALGIDPGGNIVEPSFMDLAARDFRLRPDAGSVLRENRPQGWKELE